MGSVPRRACLVLAELLEVPAIAYVVGVPSVEETVWFAGVADVGLAFVGEIAFRPYGKDLWPFAFAILRFGLGVRCE